MPALAARLSSGSSEQRACQDVRDRHIYMTASLVRCQSIVQVSCNQLVRTFPLPRYLEKWVRRETRFLVSY